MQVFTRAEQEKTVRGNYKTDVTCNKQNRSSKEFKHGLDRKIEHVSKEVKFGDKFIQ